MTRIPVESSECWARESAMRALRDRHLTEFADLLSDVKPPRKPNGSSECGTPAGVLRHRRDGEQPCAACRNAGNTYQRERSARAKERRELAWSLLVARHQEEFQNLLEQALSRHPDPSRHADRTQRVPVVAFTEKQAPLSPRQVAERDVLAAAKAIERCVQYDINPLGAHAAFDEALRRAEVARSELVTA